MGQDPDKSTGASTGLGACHISSKLHDGTGGRADRTPAKTMRQQVWNYGVAVEQILPRRERMLYALPFSKPRATQQSTS